MSAGRRPLSARIASALATALMAASGAFVLWGIWSLVAGAEPVADPFAQGKADAETLKAERIVPVLADPEGTAAGVPGYAGTDVPEKAYRDLGVAIEDAGRAKAEADPLAQDVAGAALSRPLYSIDPDADPIVQRAEGVEAAAADLSGLTASLTGTYTGCSSVTVPTAAGSWTTSTCLEDAGTMTQTCSRALSVNVTQKLTCTEGDTVAEKKLARNSLDWMYARITCMSTSSIRAAVYAHGSVGACTGWQAAFLDPSPHGWTDMATLRPHWEGYCWNLRVQERGGCDPETQKCTYTFRYGYQQTVYGPSGPTVTWVWPWQITLAFDKPLQHVVEDVWSDGCGTLAAKAASGACTAVAADECVDSGTKVVSGVAVDRPCWRYRSTYECAAPVPAPGSACESLRAAGCHQTGSRCVSKASDGTCLQWEQAFSCPTGPAGSQAIASCGGAPVCIGGDCADTSYAPNKDFALAASYLGAIEAAAKDFDTDALRIFEGTARKCKESKVLGISTYACCNGSSGLAIDLNLSMCKEDERILAEQKAAGQCHYVGSYTKGKFWNKRKYHSYCCFRSKLGRIIQEQGRAQLGIGWGSPKSPSCRGLTPEELVAINWEALDLSEFYADVIAEMEAATRPTEAELAERVRDRILNGLPL